MRRMPIVLALVATACAVSDGGFGARSREPQAGRLLARPGPTDREGPGPGLHAPRLFKRSVKLYVPEGEEPKRGWPLVLSLHGAGSTSAGGISYFLKVGSPRAIIVAPSAAGRTWDQIEGAFGSDVSHIDRLLEWIFARYRIDAERIAVLGFSDGASYALSLGITNGDLFRKIVALSPGHMAPAARRGEPQIFVAHGRADAVLPFERTGRQVARRLERAGYDVTFRVHDEGHTPMPYAEEALRWFLM